MAEAGEFNEAVRRDKIRTFLWLSLDGEGLFLFEAC